MRWVCGNYLYVSSPTQVVPSTLFFSLKKKVSSTIIIFNFTTPKKKKKFVMSNFPAHYVGLWLLRLAYIKKKIFGFLLISSSSYDTSTLKATIINSVILYISAQLFFLLFNYFNATNCSNLENPRSSPTMTDKHHQCLHSCNSYCL